MTTCTFSNKKLRPDYCKFKLVVPSINIIFSLNLGLPLLLGVCLETKPYLMISQFYGISGKCTTLRNLMKSGVVKGLQEWTRISKEIANALDYVHKQNILHNDVKGDNIVLTKESLQLHPILIDFGKCRQLSNAKWYKLNKQEKEKYCKYHCHLAPELIEGTHCQSFASDIYSFGLLLSQMCKILPTPCTSTQLKLISKKCSCKKPEDRPSLQHILEQL